MAATQDLVKFNPKILQWALAIEGRNQEELKKKLQITEPELQNLLSTANTIPLRRLDKIADYLRFPSTTFLMSEPPYELKLRFRKIAGTSTDPSRKTVRAIRDAYYWQSIAKDLLEETAPDSLEPKIEQYSVDDPVEKASRVQKEKLEFESITRSRPTSINKYEYLYNGLVQKIESLNIFVYQCQIPPKEARGFTLINELPRAIVINISDPPKPKIFTLLHEYAHILLKNESVCFPNYSLQSNDSQGVESWCNDFAGSFLMPKDEFKSMLDELEEKHDADKVITKLAGHFYSSKHAVLVRIKRLKLQSELLQDYKNMFEEIKQKELYSRGGPPPKQQTDEEKEKARDTRRINTCLKRRGRKFVKLVLDSHEKGLITSSDVIDYLQLHPRYIVELGQKL